MGVFLLVTILGFGDGDCSNGDISGGRCKDAYDGSKEASRRRGGGQALQIHHTLRISYGE